MAETAVVDYGHDDYEEGIYLVVTMETTMLLCNYLPLNNYMHGLFCDLVIS